jgi:acyl carrier protein
MDALISELKKDIVEQLNLQDIKPEDIQEEQPLFGKGLGLDSIDALELIVLLQKKYGIKINSAEEGKAVFYSVKAMADFIHSKKN